MKRKTYGITTVIVVAVVAAAFSLIWLIWFVATVAAVLIIRWKRLPATGRKLVGAIILLALATSMWHVGAAPSHFDPGSTAQSRLPIFAARLSTSPAAYERAKATPQLDELKQIREKFRREVVRLRAQGNAVELALSLRGDADKAIDYGQKANIPINDLLDAKASLGHALDGRKLDSINRLDEVKAVLDEFLQQSETRIAAETTVGGVNRVLTDFRLQRDKKSVDDVNDSMLRLEAALNRLGKLVIGDELKFDALNRVRLVERSDTLWREELISLRTRRFPLKEIDASEALLSRDPEAGSQELLVYFGANESGAVTPADSHHIPIPPGIDRVTLIKRTVVPAGLTELRAKLRLVSFRYFLLRWPTVFPAKLRLSLDLSAAALSDDYPYSIDTNPDVPIRELRLPANSLFNASVLFKTPLREGAEDVLETEQPLVPGYFLSHNYVWVELMPENLFFRNKPVQEWKQYLFPENLTAALVVMVLGCVAAFVIA